MANKENQLVHIKINIIITFLDFISLFSDFMKFLNIKITTKSNKLEYTACKTLGKYAIKVGLSKPDTLNNLKNKAKGK